MTCLDTSVLIDLLRGERTVERHLDGVEQRMTVAYPVICELFKGVYKSDDSERGEETVAELLDNVETLDADRKAGKTFGKLKQAYPHKSEFDLMVAAIVASSGVTLLTRDSDFEDVDEIQVDIL